MSGKTRRSIGIALCLGALLAGFRTTPANAVPVMYQDINGVWHQIESTAWPRSSRSARHRIATRGGGITVVFQDVEQNKNKGFDAPGASSEPGVTLGEQRQARVFDMLTYLGSLLNEPGSLDVEFNLSTELGNGGSLAFAGPLYPSGPPAVFDSGSAFKHIRTNQDPFPGSPDIQGTVDFGYNWQSSPAPPGAQQYDLQSVLLHEFTHGLGFLSLANPDGTSQLPGNVYSTFDNLVFTGNGKDLFTPAGGASFAGTAADLRGEDGGLEFRGSRTVAALGQGGPLFSPNPFQVGSSISHWDLNRFTDPKPLMIHAVFVAVQKRAYHPFELETLRDLGYNIFSETPVPAQEGAGGLALLASGLLTVAIASVLRRHRAQESARARAGCDPAARVLQAEKAACRPLRCWPSPRPVSR